MGDGDQTASADLDGAVRADVERWFVRRGLPHFIDDYNAREDVFTRAAPFLTVVFLIEILGALNARFEWWANALSLLGGVAVALAGIAVVNRFRGRRPFQRPDTIGVPELAGFVVVPAAIPLVVADQPAQGAQVLALNLVLLGVVYVVTSYAVLPTVRWALGQAVEQVGNLVNLVVRSLPLLLLFSMFLFFNAELWKITDDLPRVLLVSALVLLVVIGSAFVAFRVPRELADVARFASWRDVGDRLVDTPAAPLAADLVRAPTSEGAPEVPALRRRARVNVGLVFFITQAIQIVLVTVVIGVFYLVFGLLTIIDTTIVQWTGSEIIDVIATIDVGGTQIVLTGELVRTALFIAAVAGLQFTVAALTDDGYRREFLAETVDDLRDAFAVRAAYLERLAPSRPG